jgi:hypothetical protein
MVEQKASGDAERKVIDDQHGPRLLHCGSGNRKAFGL